MLAIVMLAALAIALLTVCACLLCRNGSLRCSACGGELSERWTLEGQVVMVCLDCGKEVKEIT